MDIQQRSEKLTAYPPDLAGLWWTDSLSSPPASNSKRPWWTLVDWLPTAWHSEGQAFDSPRVHQISEYELALLIAPATQPYWPDTKFDTF